MALLYCQMVILRQSKTKVSCLFQITEGNGMMLCHSLETLRESRILWRFIEPSFAFGASFSHFLPDCSLFSFPFRRVCARLLARGTAITLIFLILLF